MDKEKIDRINELGRIMKSRELNEEEKAEQKALREEYLAFVRASLRGTSDKAKGKEEYDRDVPWGYELYHNYFNHLKNREEYRKKQLESRERCRKHGWEGQFIYDDIVKIGTVFENADLLEE
jgi:uncharacterized protein YnzC (UPF0291/DUF896 family)